jgi:hypothetical protein
VKCTCYPIVSVLAELHVDELIEPFGVRLDSAPLLEFVPGAPVCRISHSDHTYTVGATRLGLTGVLLAGRLTCERAWRAAALGIACGRQSCEPGRQRRRRPADRSWAGNRRLAVVRALAPTSCSCARFPAVRSAAADRSNPTSDHGPPGARMAAGQRRDRSNLLRCGRRRSASRREWYGPGASAAGVWHWALAHRAGDGSLPSRREIASHYGRHERWRRLVKRAGTAGKFAAEPTGKAVLERALGAGLIA